MAEVYPKLIVPQVNFLHSLNVESLLSCYPKLLVSRRVKGAKEEAFDTFNGRSQLKDSLMGQVANMSLNLLGALFENDKHLVFAPINEYVKDWNGEDVSSDDLDGKFLVEEVCFPIFFYVEDIHNYPFTAPYYFVKESDALIFISSIPQGDIEKKYADKFNKVDPIKVKTHALMKHAPTNFNYWHCVLDSYPNISSENPIPTNCKNAQKRIIKLLRTDLIKKFLKTDVKVDYKIDSKAYINS